MMMYAKMAWRNIWRNRTRTVLTLCVVFISVFLSIIITSEEDGTFGNIIDNVIDLTGHLQVQNKDYWEDRSINQGLIVDSALLNKISRTEHVRQMTTHLESFALASFHDMTKGVAVFGIVPSEESTFSGFRKNYMKQTDGKGIYLQDDDEGVIIGEKLASYLKLAVNDTIVLISQGYHGASAAALFPVRGTIRLPSIEMESRMVYMSLHAAQNFYGASGLVTAVLLKADENRHVNLVRKKLGSILPANTNIRRWDEIQPEIVQLIDGKVAGGKFVKSIFYMILAFIIFSTMVMMMYERRKEFGIMAAMGMQKNSLSLVVFLEVLMITFLGTLIGMAGGYAITSYLFIHPIALGGDMAKTVEQYGFEPFIFFSTESSIYYWQPVTVFIMTLVIYLFPFLSIRRMNIIRAIRS